jgi:hypothetical protein
MMFWIASTILLLSVTHASVLDPDQHTALMLIYNATGSFDFFVFEEIRRKKKLIALLPQVVRQLSRLVCDSAQQKNVFRSNQVSIVKAAKSLACELSFFLCFVELKFLII